jgi:hypothetical protein
LNPRFRIFFALAAGLWALCARASDTASADWDGKYLPGLAIAERAAADVPAAVYQKPRTVEAFQRANQFGAQLQTLAAERANVGDTAGAIAAHDLSQWPGKPPLSDSDRLANARAEDAIQAIVEQARNKRIVLLNEAHHVPLNRAFALRLARALRKIGFSYLACETFMDGAPGDMRPRAPGQTVFSTGYYTKEPGFAEFVNTALADGWTPVAYEYQVQPAPGADWMQVLRDREQGEARNLVDRIFAKDKNARVLIYVGFAHLMRATPDDKLIWMSEYLERSTGLPMLRVDQTTFFAHPDRADESPLYSEMLVKFPSTEPFVVRAPAGQYLVQGQYQGHVDMQVVFPRYGAHDGRPDWLRLLAGRSPRPVPRALLPPHGRRLVKAFHADAPDDAVPIDNVLVEAGKPVPALMLPPGEYRYAVEDIPD